MTSWADLAANIAGVSHVTHVCFSINGATSTWDMGYPYDIGQALDPDFWVHQPIGYNTQPIPMEPGIQSGEAELARQLALWGCDKRTWGFVSYSMGAIVSSNIMDRIGLTKTPGVTQDLAQYRDTFIGGATFGNPRREAHHTLPGGVDPGGHGIVTPNLVGTPSTVFDFAAGKKMPGSPGQDLYTTCGYDGSPFSVADEEAVWNIVKNGSLDSTLPLVNQVLELLTDPTDAMIGAAYAILDAGMFFVVTGLTPHTSYQFTHPVPGDARDCWQMALDHMNQLGAAIPARMAA